MSANTAFAKLLKSGQGKSGYCKLCSFDDPQLQDDLDDRVLTYSPAKMNKWMATKIEDFQDINRQTYYKHREHVRAPADRMVTAIKKRELVHGSQPTQVSEQDFLDAIISMGAANAAAEPENVTIDHALKAAGMKLQQKNKGDAHQTLVQVFTTAPPTAPDIIEGESKEI